MNNITIHSNEIDPMRERVTKESQKLVELGTTAPFMMWDYTGFDKNSKNIKLVYGLYTGGDLDGKEEIFFDDFSDERRYDDSYDDELDSIGSMLNRIDDIHPEYAVYCLGENGPHRIKHPGLDRNFPYGLRCFDDPQDAFNVMGGEYGEANEGLGRGYVHILNSSEWQKMVFERFCKLCVDHNAGDEKDAETYANLENEEIITDFFTDFNYFMYHDGRYWTSLMEMKDDNVTRPCQAQWDLIGELWDGFGLRMMWRIAKKFTEGITDYDELFDKLNDECLLAHTYGNDPLDTFMDLEVEYFPELFNFDEENDDENSPATDRI